MGANSKKSMAWSLVLILLGMAALYGGSSWLTILIPAALAVWFTARPRLRTGRN
jgi:Na+/H+ antiporter NhaC